MNMKRIIYIATMLFLVTSCSEMSDQQESQAIRFQIGYPSTKATAMAFETGDAISLYAVQWQGQTQYPLQVGGNFVNDAQLTYNGSVWSAAQTL
jgi:hypothetical protein